MSNIQPATLPVFHSKEAKELREQMPDSPALPGSIEFAEEQLKPKPKPERPKLGLPDDEAEEALMRYQENERALNGLRNAQAQWSREVAALVDREDGCDEPELERLARIEGELKLCPGKIRLLLRREKSLRRKLQAEFGCRFFKVQELCHEVARELETRMVRRLEKIYCNDLAAATLAAREHPEVAAAIQRCEVEIHCIDRIDCVIGMRQLLKVQEAVVQEAKELTKK